MKATLRWLGLAALVPWLVYELLLARILGVGGATVMLGAASDASALALGAMLLALTLRIYLVLVVPPWCGFRLVKFGIDAGSTMLRDVPTWWRKRFGVGRD
jgi:hypothetical protein